ncbi:MAG: VWA domain-containing protein [Desulfovibrionales bacterium]|nr:VWA domain-containing protein [Desulfovibrionales bacterium]
MGGSSKKVTVGYKYYVGMHQALCHGPIDKISRIKVGGKSVWEGYRSGGSIFIDSANVFGGEKREGGVSGQVDIETGAPTQGVNSYLASKLGSSLLPAFRGVCCAVLRQVYVGLNPYLKDWAWRLQRIHVRSNGQPQWYNSRAEIPINAPYLGPQSFYFIIDGSGSMNELVTGSKTRMDVVKAALNYVFDLINRNRIDSGGNVRVDIGVRFYSSSGYAPNGAGSNSFGISTSSVESLKAFVNSITPGGGTEPKYGFSGAPGFFNAAPANANKVCIHLTDGEPLAGGYPDFTPEGMQQAVDEALLAADYVLEEGSPVKVFGMNVGLTNALYTQQLENTPQDEVPHIKDDDEDEVAAVLLFGLMGPSPTMNPAHIIRECLTDTVWGMGYPEDDIDEESFSTAANKLFIEGLGISILWSQQTSIEDFIDDMIRHIDATLYVDRSTGKFCLKLIRHDYDESSLIVLDESNSRTENYTRQNLAELVNEVTVTYPNVLSDQIETVTVQNLALIQQQGAVISSNIEYPGFAVADVALRAAARDLRALSFPRVTGTIIANRIASGLNIGQCFKWRVKEYEADGSGFTEVEYIMRVTGAAYGDGVDNSIRIDAIQDVFDLPEVTYAQAPVTEWVDPSIAPQPVASWLTTEMPYYLIVQQLGELDAAQKLGSLPEIGFLMVAAGRPSAELNADIFVDTGSSYSDAGTLDFCPCAKLGQLLTIMSTTALVTDMVDMDSFEPGSLAQIEDEIVLVESVTDSTLTLRRGCLDTVPAQHPIGAPVIIWDGYAASDQVEYVASDTLEVKILPVSGQGQLPLDAATANAVTMSMRSLRPYPPADVKVNGEYFPAGTQQTIVLSWVHRDRKQQTGGAILGFADAGVGPEAGTTYTVKIYDDTGTLFHTISGITGTSVDVSSNIPMGEFCDLHLYSVRGGVESWQRHVVRVMLPTLSGDNINFVMEDGYVAPDGDGVNFIV